MKYIIFALKAEAQAFVDKYKLGKTKSNDEISIIISGVGKEHMLKTTKDILSKMNSVDKIINIGICGASNKYQIGEIIDNNDLTCVNEAIYDAKDYVAVDMESDGFLQATSDFFKGSLKNVYMFKIVSDNFQPNKVTKDKTKKLIYDKIEEMMQKVDG